ncbi:MAG: DEAD/DEAH box helicase family protein [Lentisphaeria bacterium]|nr:DEAD/DEAH box helicase family protein [Lentisphaeria bacterium]
MNEEQTKLEKITPALQKAGWGVVPESRILMEQRACLIAPGRVGKVRGKLKKVDYLLSYRGRKLAIVEAKSDEKDVSEGVAQAKEYASMMQIRYTYSTNGDEIYFMDMGEGKSHKGAAESFIDQFPTPDELWAWTFPGENVWRDRFNNEPLWSNPAKAPRYYQEIAVNKVLEAVAGKKRRMLLTLATGTGKTFIAFEIAWKLFKTRWNLRAAEDVSQCRLPRILFLTDRNNLANQAFNDFGGFEDDALCRITPAGIRKLGKIVPKGASVYFTIFQTFMSGETPYYKQYEPDFFDFIIIDECHRGGANDESEWREVLTYFEPAYQLGMTATPKRKINADTYRYFGEPLYQYSLKQGIEDGYLTPYRVRIGKTPIDEYTYQPDDIILSGEDELDKSKTYTEQDFYHGRIRIKERDELRIRELMEQIGPTEKTIVFCATQNHALQIRDVINRMAKKKHPFYCVRVTADDGEKGEEQLKKFQQNDKLIPTVLTTSQKLSTGVDARNVRNIVLLRPVTSIIEFKQIIGRGTRLFDEKYFFTIYDFVGASSHFADPDWDGQPICPKCGNEPCTCGNGRIDPPPVKACPVCGKRPCVCEKPVKVCPICGNLPCTCPKKKTIEIKLSARRKREIEVAWEEKFMFDGKLIDVAEFIQILYGKLGEYCGSEAELRAKWSDPDSRADFLQRLAEAGFEMEKLKRLQALISAEKCDLLDVLEYVAYAFEMQERSERADKARQIISQNYSETQQLFLSFVLKQYVEHGIDALSPNRLGSLLETKYGSIQDGVSQLGAIPVIRSVFSGFQQHLYCE